MTHLQTAPSSKIYMYIEDLHCEHAVQLKSKHIGLGFFFPCVFLKTPLMLWKKRTNRKQKGIFEVYSYKVLG